MAVPILANPSSEISSSQTLPVQFEYFPLLTQWPCVNIVLVRRIQVFYRSRRDERPEREGPGAFETASAQLGKQAWFSEGKSGQGIREGK
jgi:hypothetical protein